MRNLGAAYKTCLPALHNQFPPLRLCLACSLRSPHPVAGTLHPSMATDARHVQAWRCAIANGANVQPLDIALLRFDTIPTICITVDEVT